MNIGLVTIRDIRTKIFASYPNEALASEESDRIISCLKKLDVGGRRDFRVRFVTPMSSRMIKIEDASLDRADAPPIHEIVLFLDKVFDPIRNDCFEVWRVAR